MARKTQAIDYEDVINAYPEIPTIDGQPLVVSYSTRGPKDFVISGPIGSARGRGRRFASESAALRWAQRKYKRAQLIRPEEFSFGTDNIWELLDDEQNIRLELGVCTRWAILVTPEPMDD